VFGSQLRRDALSALLPDKEWTGMASKNGMVWNGLEWPGMVRMSEEWDNALRNGLLTSLGCRCPLLSAASISKRNWDTTRDWITKMYLRVIGSPKTRHVANMSERYWLRVPRFPLFSGL